MPRRTGFVFAWTAALAAAGVLVLTVIAVTLYAAAFSGGKRDTGSAGDGGAVPSGGTLTIYCGRSEALVGDLVQRFERETGIDVRIKYARTGPLAAMILEEGRRSPADVFFAQDPGGLGVLAEADRLAPLPQQILQRVAPQHRDPNGQWVGVTGRLRTLCYSTQRVHRDELPASMMELTEAQWRGRIGWAPPNASFQAFVTALRHQHGEAAAQQWLQAMMENRVRTYPSNSAIVQAVGDGEIDIGMVNHYYAHRFLAERGNDFPVANHVPQGIGGEGDICGAMLLSGAAALQSARNSEEAHRFIEFLLSEQSQRYFAETTFEYPLAEGVAAHESVPSLEGLPAYRVNLNQLGDLKRTVDLLRRVGTLE